VNEIETLLEKPGVQALGWTLFHFLWQGALVGLGMLGANIALKKRTAEARYAAACMSLVLLLALPIVTLCILLSAPPENAPRAVSSSESPGASQPTNLNAYGLEHETYVADETGVASISELPIVVTWMSSARARFASLIPWLISAWFLGVVVLSGRFVGGLVVAERLKRAGNVAISGEWQAKLADLARRLRVARPVLLCQSALVQVPTVIGWLRPVVLLPASALTGLSSEQLEALLAHELAHIRRHDYLVNILQTAAETLLFYHPAVWWISSQARVERENCCDDLAVRACGNVLIYARALTDLEAIRNAAPQMAMAASGGSLMHRIERLIGIRAPAGRHKFAPSLAALGVLVMVPIMMAGAGGVLVRHSAVAQATVSSGIAWPTNDVIEAPGAGIGDNSDSSESQAGTTGIKAEASSEAPAVAEPLPQPSATGSSVPAPSPAAAGEYQGSTTKSYIDELAAAGLANLTVEDLIRLKSAGVTGDYIRTLRQTGLQDLSIGRIVELRISGVTPEFIKEMSDSGYSKLSARDLISLRIQGVTAEYIKSMAALFTDVSVRSLIELKIQGVDADYIRKMGAAGYEHLTAHEAITLKIQGVDPAYVEEMKSIGLEGLSARTLAGLKIQGVTAEYAKQMQSLGADGKSAKDLISLKVSGVTPEYIKAMQGAGFGALTLREIASMSLQGVTPEYVKEMKAVGFENLSPRQVVEMRDQGIGADYVKELKSAGYSNLSVREVVELKVHGVDAQFVRRMQDHGFKNLSARQLVQLKLAGID
jgi:beta-lactamase regulating signal transducer with metallopeptidase domain